MIEEIICDGCRAKGKEGLGVATLTIGSDSYDLCQKHADRFAAYFEDLFGETITDAVAA
ncbi:hypothetical protein [Streptomyces noursei]|uniref:hypothetical protein n=1 Tax=Streptomyces noursei TaxID=1971 RepID=UPI00167516D0|nr:hypothetical protein [Streptomyces noursei]MCZ1019387.1 hypothetical protein [Streptomyces noursei]